MGLIVGGDGSEEPLRYFSCLGRWREGEHRARGFLDLRWGSLGSDVVSDEW